MPDNNGREDPCPEVVQAVFEAPMSGDPGKLEALQGGPVSAAEQDLAEQLFANALLAGREYRDRQDQAWEILIGHQRDKPLTWEQMFEDLTPERAAALARLYDALPDEARAEYD